MKRKFLEIAYKIELKKIKKMSLNPWEFCPLTPFKIDVLLSIKNGNIKKSNALHFNSNIILGDTRNKEVLGDKIFNKYYEKGFTDGEIVEHHGYIDITMISEFRVIPGYGHIFLTNGEFVQVSNFIKVAADSIVNNIPVFYYGVIVEFHN